MRERQHDYELMFIISPMRTSEEDIGATISRVEQSITNNGGEVTNISHTPPWGRRKLAYPIRTYVEGEASRRTFNEGYYVLCHFTLPTTQVSELERTLKFNDALLRYMMTVIDNRGQAVASDSAVTPILDSDDALDAEDDDIEDGDLAEDEDEETDS